MKTYLSSSFYKTLFVFGLMLQGAHTMDTPMGEEGFQAAQSLIPSTKRLRDSQPDLPASKRHHKESLVLSNLLPELFDEIIFQCQGYLNPVSLVNKTWKEVSDQQTRHLKPKNSSTNEILGRFPNLTSLNLQFNDKITDDGIKRLTNLNALNLAENSTITNERITGLTSLTSLRLSYNDKITDEGIKGLTALTSLDLRENDKISNEGVKKLTFLTNSLPVWIWGIDVMNNHLQSLNHFPNCSVKP